MRFQRTSFSCFCSYVFLDTQSRGGSSTLEVWGTLNVFGNRLGGVVLLNVDLFVRGTVLSCENDVLLGDVTTEMGSVIGAERMVCDSFHGGPCATPCALPVGTAEACTSETRR